MQQPTLATIILYILVIGLFIFRLVRPQRMSVTRLWVMPIILLALTVFAVWGSGVAAAEMGGVAPAPWQVGAALLVGALIGIPLGVLRGRHSEVKTTDRPNVMYVKSSPLIVGVWLLAFAARSVFRFVMPHAGTTSAISSDGLMGFAVAALLASYAIIYQRYRALTSDPNNTSSQANTSASPTP